MFAFHPFKFLIPFVLAALLCHARVITVLPRQSTECLLTDISLAGESCKALAEKWAISAEDLISFNPELGSDCSGFVAGKEYCVQTKVSPPPSTPVEPEKPEKPETSKVVEVGEKSDSEGPEVTKAPGPIQPGIAKNCTNYHKVVSGDTCFKIVMEYGTFTLEKFYEWNPAVGDDCSTLLLGYYVCVDDKNTPDTPPSKSEPEPPKGPSPVQKGIAKDCTKYYRVSTNDTCEKIVDKIGGDLSLEDFNDWNPEVGSSCKNLFLGYYVCVATERGPSKPRVPTEPEKPKGPTPVQDGVAKNCNKWHKVVKGDGCAKIAKESNISLDDFYGWNTGIDDACSNLFLGYYVCVGAP